MNSSLKAVNRQSKTKSDLKQLRSLGQIPGVVYGAKFPGTAIQVSEHELLQLLKTNPHGVIELEMPEGGKQPVMISQLQKDTLKGKLLHIDLHQINMDQPIRATVAVELIGEAQGVSEGGILQVQHHEIEIRCLPNQLPESLQLDISDLKMGESRYIGDIPLSEGIELKSDADEVLVSVLAPQKEAAPEEATPVEEAAAANTAAGKAAEPVESNA